MEEIKKEFAEDLLKRIKNGSARIFVGIQADYVSKEKLVVFNNIAIEFKNEKDLSRQFEGYLRQICISQLDLF